MNKSSRSIFVVNTAMNKLKITCEQLQPLPDPLHGSPCSRSSHGLSVILNGTRLILHGGENIARTPLEDNQGPTWAADWVEVKKAFQWRQLNCPIKPPARVAHAQATFNENVFIFGGRAGITMAEQAMNDLWMLDASGEAGTESWTKVEPSSGDPPEARSFHRMVNIGTSLYVFGGCGASGRLADLHKFDLVTQTWHSLGVSPLLKGRGGANLIPLSSGASLAVVAGFAGEETADGHRFDLAKEAWGATPLTDDLKGLRPRSVCVSASFPSVGTSIIFGGEVDPSERGHEGAGGFENDLVLLDEKTGKHLETIRIASDSVPETRGWSDGASFDDGQGSGRLFIFGGLSGDDMNPKRLDDLWRLDISSA